MKKIITIILFFMISISYSQEKDTLYLKYNDKFSVYGSKENLKISFNTIDSDTRVNSYHFNVSNMGTDFNLLHFNEIKDTISKTELSKIQLTTVEELSKLSPCDIHFSLSNYKRIFLIREVDKKYYKYGLVYWSTQRGWQRVNTN